jgi:hypothetical protein
VHASNLHAGMRHGGNQLARRRCGAGAWQGWWRRGSRATGGPADRLTRLSDLDSDKQADGSRFQYAPRPHTTAPMVRTRISRSSQRE